MTAHDAADAITAQVRDAYEDRRPLRIVGQDSKAFYGRPTTGEPLDLARHSGVIRYEPTELVITARAGTLVTELEQKLAGDLPQDNQGNGQGQGQGGQGNGGQQKPPAQSSGGGAGLALGAAAVIGVGLMLRKKR